MNKANKNKLFLTILIFAVCLFSVNLSSASMHHMDNSDCIMQTICSNCFISAETPSHDLDFSGSVVSQVLEIQISVQINRTAPPSPPPKI